MKHLSPLRYDTARMTSPVKNGIDHRVLQELMPRLHDAKKRLIHEWKTGQQGWLGCPDDRVLMRRIDAVVKDKKRFTTCLVIGIGGSDLGARAAYQALRHTGRGMQLEFLGANTDPDEIETVLARLDLKKTLVNVISKSGDTIEPMTTFLIIWERLLARQGKKAAQQVVATTDEQSGSLLAFATRHGIATLPVPKNIGGRFSVLTAVGLFPLACAGIHTKDLLIGAELVREHFLSDASGGEPAQFAALHVIGDMTQGRHLHVLMPYSSRLEGFGKWFRQLWAESLGKRLQSDGSVLPLGPTPIAALGATDQHSQIQLYMEGPVDKLITFIEVEQFQAKIRVPALAKEISSMSYLSKRLMADIIHAEREATSQALADAGRPNGTIHITKVDAKHLGGLFLFFEIATGMAGHLMGVNPYDQPGVEAGKKRMCAILAS